MARRSLRNRLTLALVVAAAAPVLVTGGVLATRGASARGAAQRVALQRTAASLCEAVDDHVARYRTGVLTLASALAPTAPAPSPALDARMARFHALHPGFLSVLAADTGGRIVGAAPARTAAGAPNTSRSVVDRPYFAVPMARAAQRGPGVADAPPEAFVSEAFLGRGFGQDPIVAVSAVVAGADGRPVGLVEGSLDLRAFAQVGQRFGREDGITFVLVDQRLRVVFSSAPLGLAPLADVSTHPLLAAAHAAPAGSVFRATARPVDAAPGGASRAGDPTPGDYLSARCRTALGWTVLVHEPMRTIARETRTQFLLAGAWALGAAALAGLAGATVARPLTDPLRRLAHALQLHRPGSGAVIADLAGAAEEVALVAAHLRAMTDRVDAADQELRAALAGTRASQAALAEAVRTREAEIAARTAELALAETRARDGEAQYRLLFESSPRPAWVYDEATLQILSANAAAARLYGWTVEELLGHRVPALWPAGEQAATRLGVCEIGDGPPAAFASVHATRDGRALDVWVVARALTYRGRSARLVLVDDVTERRRLEAAERAALAAAQASETRLREVLDALDEGVIVQTPAGAVQWNAAALRILALADGDVSQPGAPPVGWALTTKDGVPCRPETLAPARALATGRRTRDDVLRLERPDGTHGWLTGTATPISDGPDGTRTVVTTVRDITSTYLAVRAVAASEARFRGILENLQVVAVCLDPEGCVTFANPHALGLLGCEARDLLGEPWAERAFEHAPAWTERTRALRDDGAATFELALRATNGKRPLLAWHALPLRDGDGHVTGVAALGHDVTAQRAEAEALRRLSERDALTGLLNRRGFDEAVAATLAAEAPASRAQAVVTIDLDGFKPINDRHGHAEGDAALRAVARLLEDVLRGTDHAARLGGDEFAIYLAGLRQPSDLPRVLERLEQVRATHNATAARRGCPYAIQWSTGAALRQPGDTLATMLARADAALYEHKHRRAPSARRRAVAGARR